MSLNAKENYFLNFLLWRGSLLEKRFILISLLYEIRPKALRKNKKSIKRGSISVPRKNNSVVRELLSSQEVTFKLNPGEKVSIQKQFFAPKRLDVRALLYRTNSPQLTFWDSRHLFGQMSCPPKNKELCSKLSEQNGCLCQKLLVKIY